MNNVTGNIYISAGTPFDTTNCLYNDGANLLWEGNPIAVGNPDFGASSPYVTLDEDFASTTIALTQATSGGGSSISTGTSESTALGVQNMTSGGGAGNYAAYYGQPNAIQRLDWQDLWIQTRLRLSALGSDGIVQCGITTAHTAPTATNQVKFRYLASESVNWRCVTRAAGVETVTDSGVAASTSWVDLAFHTKAATGKVDFYVNGTLVAADVATNVPGIGGAAPMEYFVGTYRNAAAYTFYLDRCFRQSKRA